MGPGQPALEVRELKKHYQLSRGFFANLLGHKGGTVKAVDDVSFRVAQGEILGLAGESGSGKTTIGELIVRLQRPTSGQVLFDGIDLVQLRGGTLKRFRKKVQMIFQDPYETLNARYTVLGTVAEPLKIHRLGDETKRRQTVTETLERCGLVPPEAFLSRFPHELSGGQRQRVAISRAIVLSPKFVVADEPVSMLDFSIRAGVLNLLKNLRSELGLTLLYISHDLTTIRYLCDRILVMYLGRIVEAGKTWKVLSEPLHPYTRGLVACAPRPPGVRRRNEFQIPPKKADMEIPTEGCRFAQRCREVKKECEISKPELMEYEEGRWVTCHLYR